MEDPLAERRCGRHPGKDLRVHLLEHARHAAEEVRRDLPQVLRKPLQALGERGGQAEADPEEALHPGEGVREREEEEMDVALADPGGLRDHVERGQVVGVRLHDALRGARGPGGVHDRRDVPGLDGVEPGLQRAGAMRPAAQRPECRPVEHAKPRVAGWPQRIRGSGRRCPGSASPLRLRGPSGAAAGPRRRASASPSPGRCRRGSRVDRWDTPGSSRRPPTGSRNPPGPIPLGSGIGVPPRLPAGAPARSGRGRSPAPPRQVPATTRRARLDRP